MSNEIDLMTNNPETESPTYNVPQNTEEPLIQKSKGLPFYAQISLFSIFGVLIIVMAVMLVLTNKEISTQKLMLQELTSTVQNNEAITKDFDSDIMLLKKASVTNNINHSFSNGIVTDKIFIQKSILMTDRNGMLTGTIDIQPQPTYSSHFLSQGRFNIQDRELRTILKELFDNAQVSYDTYCKGTDFMPKFNEATIYITTNNYDVGIYKNGEITLSGEK